MKHGRQSLRTVADMRAHIEQLAAARSIVLRTRWVKRTAKAYSIRERDGAADEVQTPPIRSALTYATALHEIGHILGRYQTQRHRRLTQEFWAWKWARQNALIWTPAMERFCRESLAWYAARERPANDGR